MSLSRQRDIFLAFLRVGLVGYGGGPSSIPLVHVEAVERHQWVSSDEFGDVLAIGNTLPGPIATKMAAYIGYQVGGIFGAANAVFATIAPTIVLMIVLLTSLVALKDQLWVQGMSAAVVPVVAVMLASLTWGFIDRSRRALGWSTSVGLLLATVLLIEVLDLHPAIWIAAVLLYAALKPQKDSETDEKVDR
ncbi:MAG: chromate transporter [Bacillota bacterium]